MSSTFDLSLFFSGTKIECSLNIIYFNRGEWKIIGESRSVFERQKTGSQRDFISPCRDDVTRRNRRRGWIGLEGKFWLKDGRVGHRWDFCQRVSRKIARLVKKLLLEEAASFATYIFRTRPSFSYLSLSLSLVIRSVLPEIFSWKLVRRGRKSTRISPSIPRAFSFPHSRNFARRMHSPCFRVSLE